MSHYGTKNCIIPYRNGLTKKRHLPTVFMHKIIIHREFIENMQRCYGAVQTYGPNRLNWTMTGSEEKPLCYIQSIIQKKHHLMAVAAKPADRSGSNLKGSTKCLKY